MFSPTETFESTTHPGVSFTLKRVGIGLRRDIQLKVAANSLKQQIIIAERDTLLPDGESTDVTKLPLDQQKRILEMHQELVSLMVDERLAWFRAIAVGIKETESGNPVDLEMVIENGPEDLFYEINDKVLEMRGITPEQTKNSSRPTTSQQVEDGPSENQDSPSTSVENANGDTNT